MAAIVSWIASGLGPRTFSMTGPFVGQGPAGQRLGRVAFGFGAVLMYVFKATRRMGGDLPSFPLQAANLALAEARQRD